MNDNFELHALADDELTGEERKAVEESLRTSPQANAELQSIVDLKNLLRTKIQVANNEDAWKVAVRRLDEIDKRKKAESFVSRYAWGMCAMIFALIVGAGMLNRVNGRTVGASDMARMAASMAPFSRSVASQPQDMRAWIQDVSKGAPLRLDAGRLRVMSYWHGSREDQYITVFYCLDRSGPITLVVVKGANQVTGVEPVEGRDRYLAGQIDRSNSLSWTDRGFVMTLIGDRRFDELATVADGIALR